MTPELGHAALIVALCFALVQALVPMLGSFNGYRSWMQLGHSMALGQFVFMGLSFACLANAFLMDDFSLRYVANTPILCFRTGLNLVQYGVLTKGHYCCGR